MRLVGVGRFGATVLCGRDDGGRTCANGLPVVSASVRMLGRFQKLKALSHPSLCANIELIRCSLAPNSVILITEHFTTSLHDVLSQMDKSIDSLRTCLVDVGVQLASALSYLHSEGICVGTLRPRMIRCVHECPPHRIRLAHYGINYVSDYGNDVADVLSNDHGIAPEQLLERDCRETVITRKSDIWAMGIILLEISTGVLLENVWSAKQYRAVLQSIMALGTESLLSGIVDSLLVAAPHCIDPTQETVDLIGPCMSLFPSHRPSAAEMYSRFRSLLSFTEEILEEFETIEAMELRMDESGADWKLKELPIDDAFCYWKLCGSTVESILIKNGIINLQYPINTCPSLIVEDFRMFGNDVGRHFRVTGEPFTLSMDNLREKLMSFDDKLFCHSVELDGLPNEESSLPVVVKEKDVAYQLFRTLLVRHLADGDLHHNLLAKAVDVDVPPLVRGKVWATLLRVRESDSLSFLELDTLAVHTSDRQLDVDIPRCHQYEELLTSPAAHWKLRRLLKGWLLSHPQYVYWQGCDSLAAPFLLLHFNDIPTALSSLSRFIRKYLHNFFLKDNSAIIQEYLAVFNHLVAYVDASLFSRLVELDFYPELFAIPWFLTCFAHVLPLHKLFHVWDVLLLKDNAFPLFIGLAILRQLRDRLIEATFNDAILLFSDLPDLCMERVVVDSLAFYERVPPSCSHRAHSNSLPESSMDAPRGLPCSMSALSHQELRTWSCPRMSCEEFSWRVQRQAIVAVDIRSQQEFNRSSVVRSIHYANPADNSLLNIAGAMRAAQLNQHPICIVTGKDMDEAKKFSAMLVSKGIDGVCVLDGGFEKVRSDGAIVGVS